MTTLLEAMEALVDAFSGIDGLTRKVGPVDNVVAPALIVEAGDGDFINYQVAMGDGTTDLQLTVTVFVPYAESKAGIEALMPYLADTGDKSVRAIVQADPTLGGVVTDAAVLTARNLGRYTLGDTERKYLGVEFPVEVML